MIESLITAAGIVIGAWLIVWRIGREYRIGLELQRERAREQLRLEIFKEFEKRMQTASEAEAHAASAASTLSLDFIGQRSQIKLGITPDPIKLRASDFADHNSAASTSVTSLIQVIETYEIVNPELKIFQMAFGSALHDMREAFQPFYIELLKYLPVDVPEHRVEELGTNTIALPLPNDSQLEHLKSLANSYADAVFEIGCYIYDLRVETQNIFLGELFEHRVQPRQPLDPSRVVITTKPERVRELERHSEARTEWGKTKKEAEKVAIEDISKAKSP